MEFLLAAVAVGFFVWLFARRKKTLHAAEPSQPVAARDPPPSAIPQAKAPQSEHQPSREREREQPGGGLNSFGAGPREEGDDYALALTEERTARWRSGADCEEVARPPPTIHHDAPAPLPVESAPQPAPITEAPPSPPPPRRKRRKSKQARITAKSRLLFLDVETTGLSASDRIVSLGMARIGAADLLNSSGGHTFNADIVHLVFNPGRPSHPAAQRVHGWSDDVLARQPQIAAHADTILEMLAGSDVWLAHNASFDLRFLAAEMNRIGRPLVNRPVFCTMEAAKSKWRGESARLDYCIARMGLQRSGERHGALEDAILCAALFMHFRTGQKLSLPDCPGPLNLVTG